MFSFTVTRHDAPENRRVLSSGRYAVRTLSTLHLGEEYRVTFYANGSVYLFRNGAYPMMDNDLVRLKNAAVQYAKSI